MRKILLIVALAAGCASSQPKSHSKLLGTTPRTGTIAPHAQAKKFQQQEERRIALEEGATIQGATVVR